MNYYNEFDKHAAAWLRALIADGLIPEGEVDERSISEVQPADLRGFTQCHFFAGIGGWPLALQLAGWDAERPVWTGSCPCQPFSAAGKRRGTADERHLWPEFARLIGECGPATVFGEQVASKDGRAWLAGVFADLESMGYAAAGADLCAAGVGAPHIRQRLFWVADGGRIGSAGRRGGGDMDGPAREAEREAQEREWLRDASDHRRADGDAGNVVGMADNGSARSEVAMLDTGTCRAPRESGETIKFGINRVHVGLEHGQQPGLQGHGRPRIEPFQERRDGTQRYNPTPGFWSDYDIIPFRDGKARRIESGLEPLDHGLSGFVALGAGEGAAQAQAWYHRVTALKGFGNAIVPQVAAEFIAAYMECRA